MIMLRNVAILSIALVAGTVMGADRASADAYLISCPTLVKDGNFKTIEDMCKRALAADETCPNAHYYMGMVHEKNNKPHEAFKCFQTAATNATKEKDSATASKATAAAKRVGAGLIELDALDTRLADRLHKLADEALEAGQLETAKQAYSAVLVLLPNDPKATESLEKTTKAITERGDPVKSKVAAAMLAEMWYKLGIGKKNEAAEKAKELSAQFADTEYGKEAADLLDRNFAAPDKAQLATLSKKIKANNAKVAAAKSPSSSGSASPSASSAKPASSTPNKGVDVESVEKAADEETKKMAKSALVPAFEDAYKKGKGFYANATPGSSGNQENVAHALEQFIKAESIYQRIETENLTNGDLAAESKEASMLRYGCMKMTILGH